jgi:hypothetical protein
VRRKQAAPLTALRCAHGSRLACLQMLTSCAGFRAQPCASRMSTADQSRRNPRIKPQARRSALGRSPGRMAPLRAIRQKQRRLALRPTSAASIRPCQPRRPGW